jgi:hypothetical protein
MATRISGSEFASDDGVTDWQVLFWGAKTLFRTGDFTTGAKLVASPRNRIHSSTLRATSSTLPPGKGWIDVGARTSVSWLKATPCPTRSR